MHETQLNKEQMYILEKDIDLINSAEYEQAKRNISTISSPDVVSLIDEYAHLVEQTGREYQNGSSQVLYNALTSLGLNDFASNIHRKK